MKIERKIIIALITNKKFLHSIKADWKQEYIQNEHIRLVSSWCWEYFNSYNEAPKEDIENIYFDKLKKKEINKDLAEIIETELLPNLSKEYSRKKVKIDFLIEKTKEYFRDRRIDLLKTNIEVLANKGKYDEAETNIKEFNSFTAKESETEVDLGSKQVNDKLVTAFNQSAECLIPYPGALGVYWNSELVRGGFVSLMATEKRYKSWCLLDMMFRSYWHGFTVALFQAGDMTESQQLLRGAIYLSKRSNKAKFCKAQYIPQVDCIRNQLGTCRKILREGHIAAFDNPEIDEKYLREKLTFEELSELVQEVPRYKPCNNCDEFLEEHLHLGSIWFSQISDKNPLTLQEAKTIFKKRINVQNRIKISTHDNDTLKVSTIDSILDRWEHLEGFVPDVILIDYADLLIPENSRLEFRHQQNSIWRRLRGLSQKRNALVIAPTQADGAAYSKDTLTLENYSEDKRKYAHVTAMYGLNQDVAGREKKLGIMRVNKLVIREDSFHFNDQVRVIQKIQQGRAFLGSYF